MEWAEKERFLYFFILPFDLFPHFMKKGDRQKERQKDGRRQW